MLAVEYCRLSQPGTARSKWATPASHPCDQGGHLFFFITTADQFLFTAEGLVTSRHFPHPPAPYEPQHPSSGPSRLERASLAAPVIHIFSPQSGPPQLTGSTGAQVPAYRYLLWSHGCRVLASHAPPLQSQKCDDLRVPSITDSWDERTPTINPKTRRYFIVISKQKIISHRIQLPFCCYYICLVNIICSQYKLFKMKTLKQVFQLLIVLACVALGGCLRLHEAGAAIIVQSNLAAPNWIYGSLTEKDLKKAVFDLMTQNANLLKCSISSPFYNGQKCISCEPSQYFNVSNKNCQNCSGTVTNHICA